MKNIWIKRHNDKKTKFRFEFIGVFSASDVQVEYNAYEKTVTLTSDVGTPLGVWAKGNPPLQPTSFDGMLAVMGGGKLAGSWGMFSIRVVGVSIITDTIANKSIARVTLTCSNIDNLGLEKYFK